MLMAVKTGFCLSTDTASGVEDRAASDVLQWPSVSLLGFARPAFLPGISKHGPCSHRPPAPHASTSGDGLAVSSCFERL